MSTFLFVLFPLKTGQGVSVVEKILRHYIIIKGHVFTIQGQIYLILEDIQEMSLSFLETHSEFLRLSFTGSFPH